MEKQRVSRQVWVLLWGTAIMKMATFISVPFLAVFLAKNSVFSPVVIGLVVGLSPLSSVIGSFFGGSLSDKVGRKKILIASLVLMSLVFFLFFCFSFIQNQYLQVLFFSLCNVLSGFFSSMFLPTCQACISDLTQESLKNRVFHLRYTALNIGAALGPAIGGWLGVSSTSFAFLLTSAVYLLYVLVLLFLVTPHLALTSEKLKQSYLRRPIFKILIRDSNIRNVIFGSFLFMFCYSQIEANLSQYLLLNFEEGVKVFAVFLTLNGAIVLLAQAPAYFFIKKIAAKYSLLIGCSLLSVGMMCIGVATPTLANALVVMFIGIVFISIGEVFIFPVATYLVDQLAPQFLRGSYFGAYGLRHLGLFVGPPIGGALLSSGGGSVLFLVTAVVALFAGLVYFFAAQLVVLQRKNSDELCQESL